jgi:hypothetical protein
MMLLIDRTALSDWVGVVLIYWPFGFAAMVALGTPMLLLFQRLGWTGFLRSWPEPVLVPESSPTLSCPTVLSHSPWPAPSPASRFESCSMVFGL